MSATPKKATIASFAWSDRRKARRLLAAYSGPDREGVECALLALADGDLRSLADMVELARADYRDVLHWASYTGEGELTSSVAREHVQQRFAELGIEVPKGL